MTRSEHNSALRGRPLSCHFESKRGSVHSSSFARSLDKEATELTNKQMKLIQRNIKMPHTGRECGHTDKRWHRAKWNSDSRDAFYKWDCIVELVPLTGGIWSGRTHKRRHNGKYQGSGCGKNGEAGIWWAIVWWDSVWVDENHLKTDNDSGWVIMWTYSMSLNCTKTCLQWPGLGCAYFTTI